MFTEKKSYMGDWFGTFVGINEVVDAHINSLKNPVITRGKRYILVEGTHRISEIQLLLQDHYKEY